MSRDGARKTVRDLLAAQGTWQRAAGKGALNASDLYRDFCERFDAVVELLATAHLQRIPPSAVRYFANQVPED